MLLGKTVINVKNIIITLTHYLDALHVSAILTDLWTCSVMILEHAPVMMVFLGKSVIYVSHYIMDSQIACKLIVLMHSLITHSLTQSLTRSLTHSLAHSIIHSLPCMLIHLKIINYRECNCSTYGSNGVNCDTVTGQCSCHANTQGLTCSQCKQNTFNLQLTNPSGCQPCFCSGFNATCISSSGFMSYTITTNFINPKSSIWDIESNGIPYKSQNNGLSIISNDTTYLVAPSEFLGNKLSSYGQKISVTADILNDTNGFSDGYDIMISGNDRVLVASFMEPITLALQNYTIQFHEEAGWTDLDTGMTITAFELQSVLFDLEKLQLRVSLGSKTVILLIALESTVELVGDIDGIEVDWVEECNCPFANYTGLSCQICADGYTRNAVTGSCELCQCNGYSDMCDKDSGVCFNCANNTTGPQCNMCIENHYGDPIAGIPCTPCPCPGIVADEQFSSSCMAENGTVICNCNHGHIGDQCEECDVGYFGDPLGQFGMVRGCSQCTCNGNIITNDGCNRTTGECLDCKFNTTGDKCQFCLDNYYGDPIIAKNCTGINIFNNE